MKKYLIVKLGAIGDVVMTAPAVRDLSASAEYEIHWMCGKAAAELVSTFSFVDRTVCVDDTKLLTGSLLDRLTEFARIWRLLLAGDYAAWAVLHTDWRFRLLVLPIITLPRIYMKRGSRQNLIPGRKHADEYRRILLGLSEPVGDRAAPVRIGSTRAKRTDKDPSFIVGLFPGGAKNPLRDSPLRRWPIESYVSAARALVDAGYEIVLLGGSGDRWVVDSFTGLPVTDRIGAFTLPALVEYISLCDLIVTHDTGPLHLAGMTDTPLIALFGPTNPADFAPNRTSVYVLWGGERLACRPCYDSREFAACRDALCMKSISVDSVVELATAILEGLSSATDTLTDSSDDIISRAQA